MAVQKEGRKELRDKVMGRVDWSATASEEAVNDIDGFLNDAQDQLVLDAPFLFFERTIRFTTLPPIESTGPTDTISLAADASLAVNPVVFQTDLAVLDADANIWYRDRTWDGRCIDIIEADGTVHTNRIRTIWQDEVLGTSYNFFSVVTPWTEDWYGTGPFTYRVYDDAYWFPDNTIELKSMRILGTTGDGELRILNQGDAERYQLNGERLNRSGGRPTVAYRRGHFQMPGPNVAPDAELGSSGDAAQRWTGPEPFGEFEYCFTYTWGKRYVDYQSPGVFNKDDVGSLWINPSTGNTLANSDYANNRRGEPLFESAPSPASSAVVVAKAEVGAAGNAPCVILTFPNIEYQQGFLFDGLTTGSVPFTRINTARTGWGIRIYRRRKTEDYENYTDLGTFVAGQHIPSLRKLDIDDSFYLLAELRIDELNEGQYLDHGTVTPDYLRKLRVVHGYQGVAFYPSPDAKYEVEARVLQHPERMESDNDAPQVHPGATKLIVDYARHLLYEKLHDINGQQLALRDYEKGLEKLRKRYGHLKPVQQPGQIRPGRLRRYNGTTTWRR